MTKAVTEQTGTGKRVREASQHQAGARRAFSLAASIPWAIEESYLEKILEIAAGINQISAEDLSKIEEKMEERKARREAKREAQPQSLSAQENPQLENTYDVDFRDGVAIINIEGSIFRYANLFTYYSGGVSTQLLSQDFSTCLKDPAVRAIMFNINSPGGEADGINELAEMIYQARGVKPLAAYFSGMGCSGALWIGTACDRVYCDQTARVGSIGVCMVYLDDKEALAMAGFKEHVFRSSQSPNKNLDPATGKGAAAVQTTLDEMGRVFVGAVARNRAVTFEHVLENFGAGGVLVGQFAVEPGMCDGLSSYESVLKELAENNSGSGLYSARATSSSLPRAEESTLKGANIMSAAKQGAGSAADQSTATTTPSAEEQSVQLQAPGTQASPPPSSAAAPAESSAEMKALQEKVAAQEKQLTASQGEIARMQKEARTARFQTLVSGFVGESEKHMQMLEHLATTAGEDSDIFKSYVDGQNAHAEQLRQSGLFGETGRTGVSAGVDGTAYGEIESKARAMMEKDSNLTLEQAISTVAESDPALYRRYQLESQGE
jgi:ClpP class serine protease